MMRARMLHSDENENEVLDIEDSSHRRHVEESEDGYLEYQVETGEALISLIHDP